MTSARINRGVIPDLVFPDGKSDFYFVPAEEPETAAARIVHLMTMRIPKRFGCDPIRDIPGPVPDEPRRSRLHSLNIELRAALNPAGERTVECLGLTIASGQGDADRERLRQGGL